MGIAGYQAPRREVPLSGGGVFHVKGLTLDDFAVLIEKHFSDIDALFDLFTAQDVNIDMDNLKTLATTIVAQAPGFAANVIAIAAEEPDEAQTIQKNFIAGLQIKALIEIGNLTFSEVGGVKKGLETVVALLANNKKMLTKVTGKKKAG